MLPRLCQWAATLACAFALSVVASAQEATRVDPVVEVHQKIPEAFDPDVPVRVEVRVHNAGKIAVEAVSLTDVLQTGVEMSDAEPRPDKTGNTLSWSLGQLAPGEERTVRFFLKQAGGITNPRLVHTIDVAYQARGRSVAEARLRSPNLELKVVPDRTPTIGKPMEIRISVTNSGSGPVKEVVLHSDLSEGLSHPNGKILENNLGTMESGQTRTLSLNVTPKKAGELIAKIRLQAKGSKPIEEEAKVTIKPTPLKLRIPATSSVPVNQAILFETVVENNGTLARENVEVRIVLPKEVNFVRATDRGAFDATTRTIVWDLGTIEPGERRALVWNGIPKQHGLSECQCTLVVEGKKQVDAKCPVRVLPASLDR